ncbi:DUF6286 domain-containing protein [Antrihabitans sp. YC2-6]|uniref:DUF6286 domain-containing protein n=1 Tax=Antrihabitans sp. YC2-6 TaxID=2799498 RepID=UPI0018F4D9DC|nr:DUF6286 domain-containing protein [Antrihabitans sp. YC2-6]MBJ8348714.1 hypothetical protein [Antrihabitans sp. YC2-6]
MTGPVDRPIPVARPAAARVAVGIGILLIAAGVVGVRDFLIEHDAMPGPRFLRNSSEWLSRLTWQGWMLPAAAGAIVIGVALLVAAGKRRRPTHLPTSGSPVLWLRTTDIARMSTWAALHVDGVRKAQTTVGGRRAHVRVVTDGRDSRAVNSRVVDAVEHALRELAQPPRVTVRVDSANSR